MSCSEKRTNLCSGHSTAGHATPIQILQKDHCCRIHYHHHTDDPLSSTTRPCAVPCSSRQDQWDIQTSPSVRHKPAPPSPIYNRGTSLLLLPPPRPSPNS